MKARRSWIDVLQTLRDHGCKPRLLYPAKLSFTIDGENKIFHDKNRFKQYISTNPALQKVLEGKPQPKEANNTHNSTDIWQPSTKHYHQKITRVNNHWALIPLNINGLNSPIKRHRLRERIQKQDLAFCCIQETHLNLKDRHYLRIKGWEKVFQSNGPKKQAKVVY